MWVVNFEELAHSDIEVLFFAWFCLLPVISHLPSLPKTNHKETLNEHEELEWPLFNTEGWLSSLTISTEVRVDVLVAVLFSAGQLITHTSFPRL